MIELDRDKEHTLKDLANWAATMLPPGWEVSARLEKDAGWVDLEDPDYNKVEYPTNYECFQDQFMDAVNFAVEAEKNRNASEATNAH